MSKCRELLKMKFEINDIFLADHIRDLLLTDYIPRFENVGLNYISMDLDPGDLTIQVQYQGNVHENRVADIESWVDELENVMDHPEVAKRFESLPPNRMVVLIDRPNPSHTLKVPFRPHLPERRTSLAEKPGYFYHPGAVIDGKHTLQ